MTFSTSAFVVILATIVPYAIGQCVDEAGDHVDWAILYKLPRASEHSHHHHPDPPPGPDNYLKLGLAYAYLTSKNPEAGWVLSKTSINSSYSIPGRILSPLYSDNKKKDLLYIMYNDEHPNGNVSFYLGHTKGVVVFQQDYGYWLVHSGWVNLSA